MSAVSAEPEAFVPADEVNRRIDEAVAAAVPAIIERLKEQGAISEKAAASTGVSEELKTLFQQMALTMAEVADQGTNRKRVAPEILASRTAADGRMRDAIFKYAELARGYNGDDVNPYMPAYKLKQKVYLPTASLGEVLIDPIWVGPDHKHRSTEIDWPGVPNEAMIPVNDAAAEIFDEFMKSIGGGSGLQMPTLRATPGGVVVRGAPQPLADAPPVPNPRMEDGGARIRGRSVPGELPQINVLGTLAPAARQSA